MTSVVSLLQSKELELHFADVIRFVSSTKESIEKLSNINTKVVLFEINQLSNDDLEQMLNIRQQLQFVICASSKDLESNITKISYLINHGAFVGIVEIKNGQITKKENSILESMLNRAIERYDQHLQDADLEVMRSKELEELNQLAVQLSKQSEEETKKLLQAKQRMQHLKQKIDVLQSSLMAVHQSQSLGEVEGKLNQILVKEFDLKWIRVLFGPSSNFEDRLGESSELHKVSFATEHSVRGTLVASKKSGKKWTVEDKNLMDQIASAVLLAYEKLAALHKAEQFKQQWEGTFDSIEIPLGLIDENSICLRANKAFALALNTKIEDIIGANIYKKINPTQTDASGSNVIDLEIKSASSTKLYRALLQSLPRGIEQRLRILILFDVTERRNMEKIIFHNAKMAEIGTIGSSMAHELNNPIGGMLTYAQLIKNDVAETHPAFDDIVSIEKAIVRAKDIVQTLLGFSRKPDLFENESFEIKTLISSAIEMVKIHTRSLGIEVQVEPNSSETTLTGSPSLLTQALYDVLMSAYLNVLRRKFKENRYLGSITVRLTELDQQVVLIVVDDGTAPNRTDFGNLGLLTAQQIISEHGYTMEILSSTNAGMTTKISIPRLEIG